MKFSGVSLLARGRKMGEIMLKYVNPSWGSPSHPTPYYYEILAIGI